MTAAVIVSIRVGATPLRAFEAFTEEIGEWWRPNPLFALTPRGDGRLRFEPGEGGRLAQEIPRIRRRIQIVEGYHPVFSRQLGLGRVGANPVSKIVCP